MVELRNKYLSQLITRKISWLVVLLKVLLKMCKTNEEILSVVSDI